MTICAIHQPNFFPWIPYFDKIKSSDIFIFLDNVSYPKSGNSMSSWCNRVKIKMHDNDIWFSCPIIRESGEQLIKDVKINYDRINLEKIYFTFKCAYGRNKNFKGIMKIIEDIFHEQHIFIADFNIAFIKKICGFLEIKNIFHRQSELMKSAFASSEMLVNLCRQVGATHYLSGQGAKGYMQDTRFHEEGIQVIYQDYNFYSSLGTAWQYSILHTLFTTNTMSWRNKSA